MLKSHGSLHFSISPSACVLGAMLLLILPLQWVFAAIFAASFHEFSHALAVYLCGGKIEEFSVGNRGAVMRSNSLPAGKTLICVLAGSAGSLLLVLFMRWVPRIAFCALVHTAYNLLPIYPLDGGRALQCVLPDKLCCVIQAVFLSVIWAVAIYLSILRNLGLFPLIFAVALLQLKIRP